MEYTMMEHTMDSKTTQRLQQRKFKNTLFHGILFACTGFGIVMLLLLLWQVIQTGASWLDWQFLTSMPSRFPKKAGLYSALAGSIWVIGLTAATALPIGVGTAIYLEEYAPKKSFYTNLVQLNVSNLAGVPSIVYGMLGLTVFVRTLGFGRSLLSGALTLALLILPVIVVAAQEAIRSVPDSLRQGSFALGASRWQTIRGVVIPYAFPGIMTGTILAVSRAMGEAAPLIMVGAAGFIAYLPKTPMDAFTVLPIQIFNWTSRPQADFQHIAAAGILVLMILLLSANAVAILLRNKYQNRME